MLHVVKRLTMPAYRDVNNYIMTQFFFSSSSVSLVSANEFATSSRLSALTFSPCLLSVSLTTYLDFFVSLYFGDAVFLLGSRVSTSSLSSSHSFSTPILFHHPHPWIPHRHFQSRSAHHRHYRCCCRQMPAQHQALVFLVSARFPIS